MVRADRQNKARPAVYQCMIIVHTGKDLTKRETAKVKKLAETIILKDADSMERLVDETALFLHRDVADLTESQKNMIKRANLNDPRLGGKKVLVVDDDIRNIFALTSVLERQNMQVVYGLLEVTLEEAEEMVLSGKIFDAKTAFAVLYAKNLLTK